MMVWASSSVRQKGGAQLSQCFLVSKRLATPAGEAAQRVKAVLAKARGIRRVEKCILGFFEVSEWIRPKGLEEVK